jgi:hypothetical protein
VTGTFPVHAATRDPVELGMNERDQLAEGGILPVAPGFEQYGDTAGAVLDGSFYADPEGCPI